MISDDDCKDTMQYDIMLSIRDKEKAPNTTYEEWLKPFEVDLFEEYAPKLFNTYSKPKELKKVMIELIELYIKYKQNKPNPKEGVISANQLEQLFYNHSPIPSKKKTYTQQIEAFKKHLDEVYKFMGGARFETPKGKEFKKKLQEVYDNAEEYIPKTTTSRISKQPIKDYLISLKLEGKSKEINEFIKAIK